MSIKIRKHIASFVWPSTCILAFFIFRIFYKITVSYEDEDLKKIKKPIIIASNHKNPFDPWIIFPALPFRVFLRLLPIRPFVTKRFSQENRLVKKMQYFGIVSFIYYIYDTVHIPDTDSFDEKIQPLIDVLKNGESILMFPEGKIIRSEDLGEFKKGVIYLQDKTGTPILPCSVRYYKKGLFRKKVSVSFGNNFYIPSKLFESDDDYVKATEYLREEVLRLYDNSI